MKIARFFADSMVRYGIVEGDDIIELVEGEIPSEQDAVTYLLPEVTLLAPTAPSKVVAVGLNYTDHAKEVGMDLPHDPMLFLKPSTSVIGPDENIIYPVMSERVDYEGELAVVISQEAKNVSPEDAEDYILGYTCLNDVTARDLQIKDVQFTRAKSFDTFCPIGPWIDTDIDPTNVAIETRVNDKTVQSSHTKHLNWDVFALVSFISRVMTLLPGDVIATGTPAGIGPLEPGDRVDVTIAGIGTLSNQVVEPE